MCLQHIFKVQLLDISYQQFSLNNKFFPFIVSLVVNRSIHSFSQAFIDDLCSFILKNLGWAGSKASRLLAFLLLKYSLQHQVEQKGRIYRVTRNPCLIRSYKVKMADDRDRNLGHPVSFFSPSSCQLPFSTIDSLYKKDVV